MYTFLFLLNHKGIFIHCDGRMTPLFDENGYVIGSDGYSTFISDLSNYLDLAQDNNILVIPVLWDGAIKLTESLMGLLTVESKLQSYIDNVLKPLVTALKDKVALGAWEIVNEPTGSVLIDASDSNHCYDTTPLSGSDAGWTNGNIPIQTWLKFINRQIAAIKAVDPKALATQGAWSELVQSDNIGSEARNYFSDR